MSLLFKKKKKKKKNSPAEDKYLLIRYKRLSHWEARSLHRHYSSIKVV